MAQRVTLTAILALFAVCEAAACTMQNFQPHDLVENEPVCSANGRFCVVVRRYEGIPDFTSERAGKVFRIDDSEPEESESSVSTTVTAALYEIASKSRILVAEIPLDRNRSSHVLVSDSGRYLVAIGGLGGGCSGHAVADDPLVTIYAREGLPAVRSVTVGEVFAKYDIPQLNGFRYELRQESDSREVVVLTIPAPEPVERRFDVPSAALLDEKRAVFPQPRVYVTPAAVRPSQEYLPPSIDCTSAWDASDLVRLDSRRLLERVIDGPLPAFPTVAYHARIRGSVLVDVVVSERGDVLCVRRTLLPFGLDHAANEVSQRWTFTPLVIDGRPRKFAGEMVFHFKDVDDETWRELVREIPFARK